ncbi:hypothetical protein BC628DRAFT_1316079 [Trametes gibbosa]|nr:hypothetical protein BC628DRAFT_1316079 [Trametes gibbosa]
MVGATYQAPIARLPVELLSYIFLLGAHTPDASDIEAEGLEGHGSEANTTARDERGGISPCMSSSSTTPDVFAAVSRHWRQVALGTPQLWTRLVVTVGDIPCGSDDWFHAFRRYLSRSVRCPLDIYIDARDPEWDFSEYDSTGDVLHFPYVDDPCDYTHPFRVEHIRCVLDLLLPHIARTRSLAILTDRWAPMDAALECLSFMKHTYTSRPTPVPRNLPLLETLVFMRCNEFVSYNSHFTPFERKDCAHLPFKGLIDSRDPAQAPLLPRLRQLTLSGVHLDWSFLPSLLPSFPSSAESGLQHLALSYHSPDVRPTEAEFKEIMHASPNLQTLTVRVSGLQDSGISEASSTHPVALPRLTTLELGYDDVHAVTKLFGVIDTRAITELILEDASSPMQEEPLDAEPLLRACNNARHDHPLFPRAQSVTLRRVEASAEAFESFFHALPKLRRLTIAQMFLLGGGSLTNRNVELKFTPPGMPAPAADERTLPAEHDQSRAKSALSRPWYSSVHPAQIAGVIVRE